MSNYYTKEELYEKIKSCKVVTTTEFENFLIETFLVLTKDKVDYCIKNVTFLEVDRWAEFHQRLFKEGKDNVILITKETLSIKPSIAKFILLHEIGHFFKNNRSPMSNWAEREIQDKEADKFAEQYFPEWRKYFVRDEENSLRLTKLGESQRISKTN